MAAGNAESRSRQQAGTPPLCGPIKMFSLLKLPPGASHCDPTARFFSSARDYLSKVKIGSKVRMEGSYTEHGRCIQEEHVPWGDASGKGEVRTHHPSQHGSLWGVTAAASGTDFPKPLTGIHLRVSFSLINTEPLPLQSY